MKRVLFFSLLLLAPLLAAQTNGELIAESVELAKRNPTDIRIPLNLKKVLRSEPRNEEALYQICLYYTNVGAEHHTLRYVDDLIGVNSSKPEYYWLRAQAKILGPRLTEDLFQAIEDIGIAISLNGKTTPRLEAAKAFSYVLISENHYNEARNLRDHTSISSLNEPSESEEKQRLLKLATQYLDTSTTVLKKLRDDYPDYQIKNGELLAKIEILTKRLATF